MSTSPATAPRPGAVHLPPTGDLALLAVAVCAAATSGPLMAGIAVPALAIAMWRTALAVVPIAPYTLLRQREELRRLSRREWSLGLLAGAMLAVHFGAWAPSLRLTSVASATAMVSTIPIWTALALRVRGHHVPARTWAGIAVAILGVVVVTGVDFSLSLRALAGDLLALLGGIAAAAYTLAGGAVRRTVSTSAYTLLCYSFCAVLLLAVCLAGAVPLGGYPAQGWIGLLAVTLGPQLVGHSLINRVLSTTSPTVVALALLFEVPGAALIAAIALGQRPPLAVLPGVALLLVGVAVVIAARTRAEPPPLPVD